jgi:hypothetical protein
MARICSRVAEGMAITRSWIPALVTSGPMSAVVPSTGTPCSRIPRLSGSSSTIPTGWSPAAPSRWVSRRSRSAPCPAPMMSARRPLCERQGISRSSRKARTPKRKPPNIRMAVAQSSTSTERGKPTISEVMNSATRSSRLLSVTALSRSIRSLIPTWRHQPWKSPNTANEATRSATTSTRECQKKWAYSGGSVKSKRSANAQ